MPQELFDQVEICLKEQLPFVLYRKPNNAELIGIFQSNDEVHYVKDFTETGFVFAPFNLNDNAILLKMDVVIKALYEQSEINDLNQNLSVAYNEIEKLRYFSEDISGNKYTIVANSASAILVDNNLVELSGVLANIVLSNKSTIYITSDSAKYNQITNNTNFFDNVKVIYEDNEVYSNNIDLNFEKNLIEIYGNVFYRNTSNKLYADKILLNLLTKNLKIIMKKKEDNILIISNYSK